MTSTDTVHHYHVVAGRSEGINVATIDEAREVAARFAGVTGYHDRPLTVRVWAVTDDGDMSVVAIVTGDDTTDVIA